MEYIEAPKVPDKLLDVVTQEQAAVLIENAACIRDKVVIGIFADTGHAGQRCVMYVFKTSILSGEGSK